MKRSLGITLACLSMLVAAPLVLAQTSPTGNSIYLPMLRAGPPTPTATVAPIAPSPETPTATASVGPTMTSTTSPLPAQNVIVNGGFEEGETGWIFERAFVSDLSQFARSGLYYAQLSGDGGDAEWISQRVRVPDTAPVLTYWYTALSEEFNCFLDAGFVWVDPSPDDFEFSATIVDSVFSFCEEREHIDYRQRTVDLSAYAGQIIELEFRMSLDPGLFSAWSIDDVSLTSSGGTTPPPVASPTPTATSPTVTCDPSYPTVCIPPPPPDLNCGDIPYRRFTVLSPDPHNFDTDNDGIGCESG